jgi:hypothetical protein
MSIAAPAEILTAYQRAVDRNRALIEANLLEARVTESLGCPVLYIDKPSWHNRGEVEIPGQIFFSVWMDEQGQTNYNIHALKLRHIKLYKLESRKFAAAFRDRFDPTGWPNVSTAFGPATLMQGWVDFSDEQLDSLIVGFIGMLPLIDRLLKENE